MNLQLSTTFTAHVIGAINYILPRLPAVLFDLLLGILIIRIAIRVMHLIMRLMHLPLGLRGVLSGIIETIMWIFLSIAILNEIGFSGVIYFFTGSIAAVGLAMAAGGSTLVADIIAGVFLARDPDFNIGDEVIAGETPTLGIIERMDARRTRLRDDKGVLHVIPNSIVERKEWVVIRRSHELSPMKRAAKVARQAAKVATAQTAAAVSKRTTRRQNDQ
jgi:moderate conductance mechanosensitive channel